MSTIKHKNDIAEQFTDKELLLFAQLLGKLRPSDMVKQVTCKGITADILSDFSGAWFNILTNELDRRKIVYYTGEKTVTKTINTTEGVL